MSPSAAFPGVTARMKVFNYDNVLFTRAKVKDELVYKIMRLLVDRAEHGPLV